MSSPYEERFKVDIGEIFKDNQELLEKLYNAMGKEGLSKERDELFTEMISTMEKMMAELKELSAANERQQKKLDELSDKNLNTLIAEQAKELVANTKEEYQAVKDNLVSTKDKILSYVKDILKAYYEKGKERLRSGVSSLISGMRNINHYKLSQINERVRKRNARLERLEAIETEFAATKGQVKNLFRTIFGREKQYDEQSSNMLLTYMKKDIRLLNDNDIKQGERILHSNKTLERLNERFGQKEWGKKSPLTEQLASAKVEQQKNQDKMKEHSYQRDNKGKMPPLSRT